MVNFIIYLPGVLCLLAAVLLVINGQAKMHSKLCIVISLSFAVIIFCTRTAFVFQDYPVYHRIFPFYTFSFFAVYPLFFLFVKFVTQGRIQFNFLIISFLPAFFYPVCQSMVFAMLSPQEAEMAFRNFCMYQTVSFRFSPMGELFGKLAGALYPLGLANMIGWSCASVIALKRFSVQLKNTFSTLPGGDKLYINRLLYLYVAICFLDVVMFAFSLDFASQTLIYMVVCIVYSALYFSFSRAVFLYKYENKKFQNAALDKELSPIVGGIATVMENSQEVERCAALMYDYVKNKEWFKDPDLTINELTKAINCEKAVIMQVLMTNYHLSFMGYVTQFRVEYAKSLLIARNKSYTMETIAKESGFVSKNAFLAAFKRLTGISAYNWQINKYIEEIKT